jgi:hypothetical protein
MINFHKYMKATLFIAVITLSLIGAGHLLEEAITSRADNYDMPKSLSELLDGHTYINTGGMRLARIAKGTEKEGSEYDVFVDTDVLPSPTQGLAHFLTVKVYRTPRFMHELREPLAIVESTIDIDCHTEKVSLSNQKLQAADNVILKDTSFDPDWKSVSDSDYPIKALASSICR